MKILELLINEVTLFVTTAHFPASSFKEETSDIGTSGSKGGVVLNHKGVFNIGSQADTIERQVLGTGGDLHDSSQVGHGIEQGRDP